MMGSELPDRRGEIDRSDAGIACGILADLAVFAHVIEGERHHDDHERWVESAVQRGLPAWEDVLEPGGLDRVGDRDRRMAREDRGSRVPGQA